MQVQKPWGRAQEVRAGRSFPLQSHLSTAPCTLQQPAGGLLSPALILVHRKCAESQYIARRPLRVNAGLVSVWVCGCGRWCPPPAAGASHLELHAMPPHACAPTNYCYPPPTLIRTPHTPHSLPPPSKHTCRRATRTCSCGLGGDGSTRSALVGRVKIEARPLVGGCVGLGGVGGRRREGLR